MQFFEIIRIKLFCPTMLMKAKGQIHNDGTNQDAGNNDKCQDVCDDSKHTIPGLSSFCRWLPENERFAAL